MSPDGCAVYGAQEHERSLPVDWFGRSPDFSLLLAGHSKTLWWSVWAFKLLSPKAGQCMEHRSMREVFQLIGLGVLQTSLSYYLGRAFR